MAESMDRDDLPQAIVVPKRTRISAVWVIPVLAAAVAIGIAIQRMVNEGPTITIVFKAAEGLEAGKTVIKYKDVNIGQVTAVELASDYASVEVTAKMAKRVAGLMVDDATFWVVKPRLTLSGVSGLGTLLSGNYIGFELGRSEKEQRSFTGIEVPPIVAAGQLGREFLLKAEDLGSLGVGSPIYYRRLPAGQVVAYHLASAGDGVEVNVFINEPYDQYVNAASRFWNASGVDVSVGAGGVDVRTQSLIALIAGGLSFDTPSSAAKAERAAPNTVFTLHSDRSTAMKQQEAISERYVLYFNESLRGLSAGAPVTLLGLPAGEVTDVGLDLDPATLSFRGRVEIVSYPERLIANMNEEQAAERASLDGNTNERHGFLQRMVEQRGLRAQLHSGSLLTGQLYVALDFFPDAPAARLDWTQDVPELPVTPRILQDIETRLTSILAKVDELPFDVIGDDLKKCLVSLERTLGKTAAIVSHLDGVLPVVDGIMADLRRAIATADGMLKNELNTTLVELRRAVATVSTVLTSADANLLDKNAPVQQELSNVLHEFARAAQSLRALTDYLERHPEALIRGKPGE